MSWSPALIAGIALMVIGALGLVGALGFFFWMRNLRGKLYVFGLDRESGDLLGGSGKRKDKGWAWKKKNYEHSSLKLDMSESWSYHTWYGERPAVLIDANSGRQLPKKAMFPDGDLDTLYGTYHDMFCQWVNADAVRQHAEAQRDPWARVVPIVALSAVAIVTLIIIGNLITTIAGAA